MMRTSETLGLAILNAFILSRLEDLGALLDLEEEDVELMLMRRGWADLPRNLSNSLIQLAEREEGVTMMKRPDRS